MIFKSSAPDSNVASALNSLLIKFCFIFKNSCTTEAICLRITMRPIFLWKRLKLNSSFTKS